MDNIYDTLAKLNKVANAPEIVKEDSHALMKKGLEDLMKKTKLNKDADYKPFGKGDKDYETGLPRDAKKDKMFDDMAAADAAKMNKQKNYTPFSDKQSPDGLPEKKKDDKMFEGPGGQTKHEFIRQLAKSYFGRPDYNEPTGSGNRRLKIITGTTRPGYPNDGPPEDTSAFEKQLKAAGLDQVRVKADGKAITILYPDDFRMQSLTETNLAEKESDVERDDRAEKAGREVAHDAKYDGRRHAGKDGKDVTKDIEYDEKHDKDGMHEGENSGTLKDAARQGVMARLAELAGLPVQEIEEALGTPQDVAAKIMAENPLDEDEVEEGNEFSGERDKAIKAGKDSFEVDGKTYPVKGDKNESLEESDIDQIAEVGKVYPKIAKLKMKLVDDGMEPEDAHDEACEKYGVDPAMCDKYIEMQRDSREGTKKESQELDESALKDMMQDVEEGMDKKEFEKKYPGQNYDEIKKDIEDRMDETTSSGSIATSEGAGKPLYQNASVYENNEIVKRAIQLNEDMSISVNAGTNAEPSININASGEEAAKLAQLLKLAGMGMAQPGYGEVQVDVAEDQEFANGADDENTMDTEYMTQDIAGGLNGPKKMAYPKVAGGDNPMSVLGESELNEVSEDHLMKLYQEYKAK